MSQQTPPQRDAAAATSARAGDRSALAERRRLASQRQNELADILASAVFDLFLRRLEQQQQGRVPGGDDASTD